MTSPAPDAPAAKGRARAGPAFDDVPIRGDISAQALRLLASKTPSLRVSLRMRAIAHVLGGASLVAAAAGAHVRTRTLQNWIARYNAEGIAGLADRRASPRDLDDSIGPLLR